MFKIAQIQKGEIEAETCVNLCKLTPILQVLNADLNRVLEISKLAGFAASKIFKEHPNRIESIQSLSCWSLYFEVFGEEFGDLNLSIQRALYRNPQANTFCLPSENDPYFQEIYNEAKMIFDKISTDAACLFPKLSLNKKALGKIGGFCDGATLHIAKDILMQWNNESLYQVIKTVGQKYTTRVTKEAFITQIASLSIHMEATKWNDLFSSIYQSLSSTNPISRVTTLFLIAIAYEVSWEKIEVFINKHSLDDQDCKIMKELFVSDEIKQLATLAVFELGDKGRIDETPFFKLMQRNGIIDSDIELIKNSIYSFYSIKQLIYHSDSKAFSHYEKVKSCADKIFKVFYAQPVKRRGCRFKILHKSIGLALIKYNNSIKKTDKDILEDWFNNAPDGVYSLELECIIAHHFVCLVKKNGLIYMIDPNLPLSKGEPFNFKVVSALINFLSQYPLSPGMTNHCYKISKITLDQNLL